MFDLRWRLLSTVALTALLRPVFAAEPTLPPTAVTEDVARIVALNLQTLKASDVVAAAEATLGKDADLVVPFVPRMEDKVLKFADLGAQVTLDVTCYRPATEEVSVVEHVLIRFAAGTDHEKVGRKAVDANYGPNFAEIFDTRWDGDWLTIFAKEEPPLVEAKPGARAARIEAAYKSLGQRSGTLLLPTERLRELDREARANTPERKEAPEDAVAFNDTLLGSQWASMAVKLGKQPSLEFTVEMGDEAHAKKLLANFRKLQQYLKKSPGAKLSDHGTMVASAMNDAPTQKGSRVGCLLDTQAIRPLVVEVVAKPLRAHQPAAEDKVRDQMRAILLAILEYEEEKGELPNKLADVKPFLTDEEPEIDEEFKKAITNAETGEYPGFLYKKPAKHSRDVKAGAATTVVLEELKDGKANPEGHRGFLDGSVKNAEAE